MRSPSLAWVTVPVPHQPETVAIVFMRSPPPEYLLLCSAWEHTHPAALRETNESRSESLALSTEHDTESGGSVGAGLGSADEIARTLETAADSQEDNRDETMGFSLGAAAQGHLVGVSWCAQNVSSVC